MADTTRLRGVGAWHLMPKPKSFRHENKTYIGWVNHVGELGISAYDHTSQTLDRYVVVDGLGYIDDHSAPAIYRREDGHFICMFSPRDPPWDEDSLRWYISENPDDLSSWGDVHVYDENGLPDDYPQIVEWDGNLRVYFRAERGENDVWYYLESTDGLETIDGAYPWVTGQPYAHLHTEPERPGRHRIYVGIAKEERDTHDRLHMTFGGYRQSLQAVRHWYLENGTYYDSYGNPFGTDGQMVDDWSNLTTVWEGTEDHYTDSPKVNSMTAKDGDVYITFQDIKLVAANNTDGHPGGDYRGRWAHFDSSTGEWFVSDEVLNMGPDMSTSGPAEGVYHKGSFEVDPQNPTTVFGPVHVGDTKEDRRYQIREYRTPDNGETWNLVQNLSDDTVIPGLGGQRGGAMGVKGHDGDELRVIWWEGKHDRYNDFEYHIKTEQVAGLEAVGDEIDDSDSDSGGGTDPGTIDGEGAVLLDGNLMLLDGDLVIN